MTLTHRQLKRNLSYSPETGEFRRLVANSNRVKIGDVAGHKHKNGYVQIFVCGTSYWAHRLAYFYMTAELPPKSIDHINGDPSDNRWLNLRAVSQSLNMRNMKRPSNNTSGVIGVCLDRVAGKWRAQIEMNWKNLYLGNFENKADAIAARKSAEIEHGFHENHGRLASIGRH